MEQAPLAQSRFTSISPAKIWSSLPSAPGMIEKVFEIPSCESMNGSFATDASEAIRLANENMGVVVDSQLHYIFKRARNTNQTALRNLTPNDSDARAASIAKSISIILNREEVGARVNELMSAGQTPIDILTSALKDAKVIELKDVE